MQRGRQLGYAPADQRDQFHVDLQIGLFVLRALDMQSTIDLAALQHRTDQALELRLPAPQFIGHPELHVEVSVIDRLEFPRQRAEISLGRLSCKPCHTV